MTKSEIIVLIFLIWASAVKSYVDINAIIIRCQESAGKFHSNEDSYAQKTPMDVTVPDFAGGQFEELQEIVYNKEKAQTPFECITNNVPEYLHHYLKSNSLYQRLVTKCNRASTKILCGIHSYKYRTFDGTCNNLENRRWGSSLYRLRRMLPANYNGASGFRQSKCKKPLPDPRRCSLHISSDKNRTKKEITQMLSFFGQAIAHDFADIPTSFVGTKTIECCPKETRPLHPQCAPILLKKNDVFYSRYNVTCMNVVRAATFDTCDVGKRSQMNQCTSYIDLSFVYGLSDNIAKQLRTMDGTGKLRVQNENNESLLPALRPLTKKCHKDGKLHCFLAGDRRVNMHTVLIALHTLFLREHNRLAEELHKMNPGWKEERLYQTARNINIAQFQVIVYKEFLPLLLGEDLMDLYSLRINPYKTSFYSPYTDASLYVEFNTAAFRLHTLLNGVITKNEVKNGLNRMKDIFQNVAPIYEHKMSSILHDLCQTSSQQFDKYITEDLTNYMYKPPLYEWGFDIAAANILRGRDVGLPTYVDIVRYITNGKINIQNFKDLKTLMDEDNIKNLEELYCNVEDIDMWVGITNERVYDSMLIGPTAAKIIAIQFANLRYGDRFFFDHLNNFNFGQLQSLKEVTLSSILCVNLDIKSIQANCFRPPDSITNPYKECKMIPKLDINHWREGNF